MGCLPGVSQHLTGKINFSDTYACGPDTEHGDTEPILDAILLCLSMPEIQLLSQSHFSSKHPAGPNFRSISSLLSFPSSLTSLISPSLNSYWILQSISSLGIARSGLVVYSSWTSCFPWFSMPSYDLKFPTAGFSTGKVNSKG